VGWYGLWPKINLLKKSFVGVACGSAATMNEGTQLFKLEDAKDYLNGLTNNEYNSIPFITVK
jgi:fructose-1-phosphate kinase PfkB-like protein